MKVTINYDRLPNTANGDRRVLEQQLKNFLKSWAEEGEEFTYSVVSSKGGPSKGPFVRITNFDQATRQPPKGVPIKVYSGDSNCWYTGGIISSKHEPVTNESTAAFLRRLTDAAAGRPVAPSNGGVKLTATAALAATTPKAEPLPVASSPAPIATRAPALAPVAVAAAIPRNGQNGHGGMLMTPQQALEIVMESQGASALFQEAFAKHKAAKEAADALAFQVECTERALEDARKKLQPARAAEQAAAEALAKVTPTPEKNARIQEAGRLLEKIAARVTAPPS